MKVQSCVQPCILCIQIMRTPCTLCDLWVATSQIGRMGNKLKECFSHRIVRHEQQPLQLAGMCSGQTWIGQTYNSASSSKQIHVCCVGPDLFITCDVKTRWFDLNPWQLWWTQSIQPSSKIACPTERCAFEFRFWVHMSAHNTRLPRLEKHPASWNPDTSLVQQHIWMFVLWPTKATSLQHSGQTDLGTYCSSSYLSLWAAYHSAWILRWFVNPLGAEFV